MYHQVARCVEIYLQRTCLCCLGNAVKDTGNETFALKWRIITVAR